MTRSDIGEIIYQGSESFQTFETIKHTLKSNNFQTISLSPDSSARQNPISLCVLPNGHILCANMSSIIIYDENFNVIKKMEANVAVGCVLNHKNTVYISERDPHCIHEFDLNLEKIKSVGSKGSENNNFNIPLGISYRDDHLYVCDYENKRIQILDIDLNFFDAIKLDYRPCTIQISNTTIGVHGENGIYFYDLKTKALKNEYKNFSGRISYIYSNFYVMSIDNPKKAYLFDHEGNLVDEFKIDKIMSSNTMWCDASILCYNKSLLVSSYCKSQLYKFSLK